LEIVIIIGDYINHVRDNDYIDINCETFKLVMLSPTPTNSAQPIPKPHPLQSKFLPTPLNTDAQNQVKEHIRYQETQYISKSTSFMQKIQNMHKKCAQYAAKPEICTKSARNMHIFKFIT